MLILFSVYVQSNTIVGDVRHPTGVVLAEIIKPNIPVRNGVVHLIQRPLMVVDTTVKDFLEVSAWSIFCYLFYVLPCLFLFFLFFSLVVDTQSGNRSFIEDRNDCVNRTTITCLTTASSSSIHLVPLSAANNDTLEYEFV